MSARPAPSDPAPGASAAMPVPARRHPLVAELARRLAGACGVGRGERIVVAVSGGPDSLALLTGCVVLRDRADAALDPVAVHVHHHLRAEADDDARHVETVCRRFAVELHVEHVRPDRETGNVAEAARRMRYAALARVAAAVGAGHVAVAHHAEDQLETVLMGLCRGGGVEQIAGMRWRGTLPDGRGLVRPLLRIGKAECEDLCRAADVAWRHDPTNDDPDTPRGRLRRDVTPVLETLWPGAARRAAEAAESAAAAAGTLRDHVETVFGPPDRRTWPRRTLATLPPAVVAEGLRRAAVDEIGLGAPAPARRELQRAAEAIVGPAERPRTYDWPSGLELTVTAREVVMRRR